MLRTRVFHVFVWLGLAVAVAGSQASAAELASESFAYPDGTLLGGAGGTGWSTTWNGFNIDVLAGAALAGSRTDIQAKGTRNFTNPESANELFVSFDLVTPAALAPNDWFVFYCPVGANSSSLALGVWGPNNEFVVGVGGSAFTGIPAQPSTSYHLVGSYDLEANKVCIWVDPDGTDYYDTATGANSADASLINVLAGHSWTAALETIIHGLTFDHLVIGNAPADVGLLSGALTAVPAAAGAFREGTARVSPNPCREEARLLLDLPAGGLVTLRVWDVQGREVETIDLGVRPRGSSEFAWNVGSAAPGAYFYRVGAAGSPALTGKFVVQR